jgi:uncharacterized membrane protein YkvI
MSGGGNWFQRLLLPGFAYKATVIGGGYATGRELAEYFIPAGPQGGLLAMLLVSLLWSVICSLTFLIAYDSRSFNYRNFFTLLLGRFWLIFEVAYLGITLLVLSVFGAAAGAMGAALLGWPTLAGTVCLMLSITVFATYGNRAVEQLFKYVSYFLYGTYALFLGLSLTAFGPLVLSHLTTPVSMSGWVTGGVTYASYSVVGAVIILPTLRHLTSRRDAVIAGVLAGPLAMVPAMVFFLCMLAFYPEIGSETLPSNYLLERIGLPVFQYIFQAMIFAALVECGTGFVHAINERIAVVHLRRTGADLSRLRRSAVVLTALVMSIFVADRFGLVELIASGYRLMAYLIIAVYLLPLFTMGVWRLVMRRGAAAESA